MLKETRRKKKRTITLAKVKEAAKTEERRRGQKNQQLFSVRGWNCFLNLVQAAGAPVAAVETAVEAAAEAGGGRDKNNITPRLLLSPPVGLILGPYLVAPPFVQLGGRSRFSQKSNLLTDFLASLPQFSYTNNPSLCCLSCRISFNYCVSDWAAT